MAAWIAALDGGGTKTACALADRRGGVSFLPVLSGCNPQDGPGWAGVLRGVLARALQSPGGVAAAALGLPGFGEVPKHDAEVLALLHDVLTMPFEPMNDVFLAHLGAFGGREGVLVLSGTGSMAVARGPLGTVRVGGWGDVLGDEGSASSIGREALALSARALDGREEEALAFAHALCTRLGSEATGDFAPLTWLMAQPGTPRAAAASVARELDGLADEGHAWAWLLLKRGARELTGQAHVAARRAGLPQPFPWVASGGMFRSPRLREFVAERLGPPDPPRLTTLGGGLVRAAELAGWAPDPHWAAHVDAQLRAWS